jgi:broad specificity phosphatase PhoE
MTTFHIVRHGETDWNRTGMLQGNIDTRLNVTGVRQMVKLRCATVETHWDVSYHSPLLRARQSHRILNKGRDIRTAVVAELSEMCFGEIQGCSRAQLDKDHTALVAQWWSDPWNASFPGGETLAQVDERVSRFVDRVTCECEDKSVLIAAHGVVNRLIIMRLLSLEQDHFWKLSVKNASLTSVDLLTRTCRTHDVC